MLENVRYNLFVIKLQLISAAHQNKFPLDTDNQNQGESNADNNQTKLYFIQHLRTLPSWLLQLQLSLSNEMTDQLLHGPIRRPKLYTIVGWFTLLSPSYIFLTRIYLLFFKVKEQLYLMHDNLYLFVLIIGQYSYFYILFCFKFELQDKTLTSLELEQ